MDWQARLVDYPKDKLQRLARNAAAIFAAEPDSPREETPSPSSASLRPSVRAERFRGTSFHF